jgi:hypothetical protein
VGGRDRERALPSCAGGRRGGHAKPQAPAGERLGKQQPPVAEHSQQRAIPPARGLTGDGRKGAGETGEAEQRSEQAGKPSDPDPARTRHVRHQQQRGERGEHEQPHPGVSDGRLPTGEQHRAGQPDGARQREPPAGALIRIGRLLGSAERASRREGRGGGEDGRRHLVARAGRPRALPLTAASMKMGARAAGERALMCLLERLAQVRQRAAIGGIGGEGVVEGVGERPRQVATVARERLELAADAPSGRRRRGAAHRIDPAERLVQDERERVQVGLLADLLALALLGGHVGERAEHVAGARQRILADEARTAEVRQLGGFRAVLRAVRDEHVLRLDVAVDDAARVRVGERAGECDSDREQLLVAQVAGGDQGGEGAPLDQLGDQVAGVLHDARLIQRDDPRVRQARRRERLPARALAVAVGAEGNPLERNLAVQYLVVRAPDDAEPARAEAFE